jgi:hypothetical protein
MVDYGSLDGGPTTGYWSPAQMYDVVSGLRPDVPFPQIYGSWMPAQWAALSSWAFTNTGHPLAFGGVLTQSPDGYNPQQAYDALTAALAADPNTAQPSIQWSSNIGPLS